MVSRKVFGHKRKEVKGGHRILHNEEFHDLCFSEERLVARVGDGIDTGRWWAILKGKGLFGRPRCRRDDTIIVERNRVISRMQNSYGSGKWQVAECGLHKMQGRFVTGWLCCRQLSVSCCNSDMKRRGWGV
jgi:hypothetical protein